MSTGEQFDFAIIGGGIVGLATAHEILVRYPGASLVVLEKEQTLGQHQTGHNSGVIHSGIYYAPGSLKAQLCRAGEQATKAFCSSHNIAFEKRGKLIVATSDLEVERLNALEQRAAKNNVIVQTLSAAQVREREPNIVGKAALYVPASAIVSYPQIVQKLAELIVKKGGEIRTGQRVDAINRAIDFVNIGTNDADISTKYLIACAGLQSDRVARMAGLDADFRIVPFRGEYYRVRHEKSDLVHTMIYPVPDPDLPFLGIHLTPLINGDLNVGPNAVLGFAREGYAKGSFDLKDALETASFPGFWRTALANLRSGADEMLNSNFKFRYLDACRKYCPSLELDDLEPMEAGIRAQAVGRDGTLLHDFLYLQTERMLHVCNAPSPAATSALPIAKRIADRIEAAR